MLHRKLAIDIVLSTVIGCCSYICFPWNLDSSLRCVIRIPLYTYLLPNKYLFFRFSCQLTVSFAFKICIAFREALTGILILRLIHVALFALSKINSAVLLCYSILISSWIALCKNEIREKKTDHKQALTWCVGDSSGPHCHLCKSTKRRLGWAMK